MPTSRVFFSADEDYLSAASQELRDLFSDARIEPRGPDLGSIVAEGLAIADIASACREQPVVFVRHLFREAGFIPLARATDLDAVSAEAVDTWLQLPVAPAIALHTWASGPVAVAFRTDEFWRAIAERLQEQGIRASRSGPDQILSACITPDGIVLGLNGVANALTDWPGGRVRLARPKGQISRSEFKLEELFRTTDLPIPTTGIALDLGAAPGGWTRILRQRGLRVWAVDPADLDPRIGRDPDVHHIRTTARPFLVQSNLEADLVVNDMRMTADLSVAVMRGAVLRLKPGGVAIQTLKITPHGALRTVRNALSALGEQYEILFARQLYHNRNEVTVVARRPTTSRANS